MGNQETLSAAALYSIDFAREMLASKSVVALTGAGISTDSGIPDYRGQGRMARHPMTFDVFMSSPSARARYWVRSYVGWSRIADAKPNAGHLALASAEQLGRVTQIITQNVDALHQAAGSKHVINLHGCLDLVRCTSCGTSMQRTQMDEVLKMLNPDVQKDSNHEFTPDGDVEIEASEGFVVPDCSACGGILKPDIVFFGESVPQPRVEYAMSCVDAADALLLVGTSLAVNSGLRFARRAAKFGKSIIIVNIGSTKADELAMVKIEANASLVLGRLFVD